MTHYTPGEPWPVDGCAPSGGTPGTCGTCRHWCPPDPPPDEWTPGSPGGWTHGKCQRIPHDAEAFVHWKPDDWEVREWMNDKERREVKDMQAQPAVTMDGSGYKADLRTRPEFGCTLWRKK